MNLRSLSRLAALATATLTFSGCSPKDNATAPSGPVDPAAIKLGFLVKQPEEPWFQFEWKGADAVAAEAGFELLKYGAPDGEKVMAAIDNLAVAGAQGFVICTPDVRLGPQIMARASRNGMKVIAIDDQFVLPDGTFMSDVPYIGMSAAKIGESVGEALAAEMQRRGWLAAETGLCLVTFEELDTARERTEGVRRALQATGFPSNHVYKAAQRTTDIPGSFDATAVLLTRQNNVRHWLVAGMNDNAVLGAVRAMEGRGFTADQVIGIGINGTDCIDELRKPNPTGFFGSMLVSAPAEGRDATAMLYRWIKDGVAPPLDTRTPGIFITRDNFEAVLQREGIVP